MKEKINWKQTFVTAIVTVSVTVIAGIILYYFQINKPSLSYSISQVEPFQSKVEQLTIYHIKISNDSKSMAENIQGYIEVKPANIMDYKIKTEFPLSMIDSIVDKNRLFIKIVNLNSDESINISLMASSITNMPDKPKIIIRANGVTAEIKESNQKEEEKSIFYIVLVSTMASIVASVFLKFSKNRFNVSLVDDDDKKMEKEGKHTGVDQQHVFAYLLNLEGLSDYALKYRRATHNVTYWSESDALTFEALNMDNEFKKQIINVFQNLIQYAVITNTSLAVIKYNLSKLYKEIDEVELHKQFLSESMEVSPTLINKRIAIEKQSITNTK